MIVATAGHIDHGKTTLVKALTGIDADRLPEEKARGITLDLGFAYAPAGGLLKVPLGFVDVPGHERLVRTMVAGVTGSAACCSWSRPTTGSCRKPASTSRSSTSSG